MEAGGRLWICYADRRDKIWVCHCGKKPSELSFPDGSSARVSPQTATLRGEAWEDEGRLRAFLSRLAEAMGKKGGPGF